MSLRSGRTRRLVVVGPDVLKHEEGIMRRSSHVYHRYQGTTERSLVIETIMQVVCDTADYVTEVRISLSISAFQVGAPPSTSRSAIDSTRILRRATCP